MTETESIIPAPRILAPVCSTIEQQIQQAQQQEPDPRGGPSGKLYVPANLCPQALAWGHASPFTAQPGTTRTLELLRRRFFLQQVVWVHGLPTDLVSDQGPQFASRFWGAFCKLIGAIASLTSGFYTESNGQTERVNQDLERTLRCVTSSNPSSWSDHLMWASMPTSPCGTPSWACHPLSANLCNPPQVSRGGT